MTTHQTIEELVNQKFDPISQKIDDIEYYLKLNPTTQSEIFPYFITDELKQKMIEKTIESYVKEIELGFSLCKNKKNNNLIDKGMCIGTDCDIDLIIEKCEIDEVVVGIFHTHKRSEAVASVLDLYVIYELGLGISIIGGYNENNHINIKLYERKNEYNISVMKYLHNILEKDIKLRKKLEEIDDNPWNDVLYNKMRNRIIKLSYNTIDKYFNIIDIVT